MGLFNKKDSAPELPRGASLPELPKINKEENQLPELPSFPTDSKNDAMNQEIVKSAITDVSSGEKESDNPIPELPKANIEKFIPPRPLETPAFPKMQTEEISSLSSPVKEESVKPQSEITNKTISSKDEPIFVRIDKFQSSQKSFNEIKDKISEMESVLSKIKDVKTKEEAEIKGWTEDVENIKIRLGEIDSEIFSQV